MSLAAAKATQLAFEVFYSSLWICLIQLKLPRSFFGSNAPSSFALQRKTQTNRHADKQMDDKHAQLQSLSKIPLRSMHSEASSSNRKRWQHNSSNVLTAHAGGLANDQKTSWNVCRKTWIGNYLRRRPRAAQIVTGLLQGPDTSLMLIWSCCR